MGFNANTGLREDIACGTGFVVETGFFCVYTCLFIAALPVLTGARRLKDTRSANSAWVFLIVSILMYMVATTHLIFAGFQFYRSTFFDIDPKGPISYLHDPNQWEFLGLSILAWVQTWLGDALVIYRCYIVWDNNIWLISIPLCLLLATIGINFSVLYWFHHPSSIPLVSGIGLVNSFYPLAFVQNFMTTSLIILRIFLQQQASKKAGIMDAGTKLSLMRIVRMVVESAAIYTVQILVLNILYFRSDSLQFVVQPAIIPSIGSTFVLLALRIEASRYESSTTRSHFGIRSSLIPQWLHRPDSETGSEGSQNDSSLPTGDDTAVTEHKFAVHRESHMKSINWGGEFSSDSATRPKAGPGRELSFIMENDSATSCIAIRQS